MTATCMYCGQEVFVPNEQTEGWEVCTCTGAKMRQRYNDLVLEGDELIDEIFSAPEEDTGFKPISDPAADTLRGLLRDVAAGTVGAVTVNLPDGSRAAMKIDGNGELEISRSKRRKISNATHVK